MPDAHAEIPVMQPAFLASSDYTRSSLETFESQEMMITRLGLGLKT